MKTPAVHGPVEIEPPRFHPSDTGPAKRRAASFIIVGASLVLALGLRMAMDPLLHERQPFAAFYAAVAVVVWFAGFGPGLVTIVLGYLLADYFFLPPRYELAWPAFSDLIESSLYFSVSFLLVALTNTMRKAERRASEEASAARTARAQAEAALDRLARLQAITEAALVDLPFDTFLGELVRRVRAALRTDTAVLLLEQEDGVLHVRAVSGLEGVGREHTVRGGSSFAGRIAMDGRPLVWDDVDNDGLVGEYIRLRGIRSLAGVPLLAAGRVVGVLHVGSLRRRKFRDDEVHLLELAAERVALGIERAARVEAERQARLTAEAANRAKDEFLALLAHELRNPLAPLRNSVGLLRRIGPTDPQIERVRDIIDRQVSHMVRLVDDLLDVSRVTCGKMTLQRARVSLGDVIAQAVETARPLMEAKGHVLRIEIPPPSLCLEADGARLVQVVGNLLTNAAKFTPAGGVVTISLEHRDGEAVVRVRDTGVGIGPEMLAHVFEPFVQEDPALDRQQGGLGLGLTLAKRLVEMHGGQLVARSEGRDRGSEFTITLPAAQVALPIAPAAAPADEASCAPLDVLIVEDNRDAAESLTMYLELLGHRVRVAHDGPSALRLVETAPSCVALVDIGLPGMNGYEVASRMRERPDMRHAVLVALTGYGGAEDRRRALEAGFDCHLVKPVDPDTLDGVLARHVDGAIAGIPGGGATPTSAGRAANVARRAAG